MNLEKSSSNAEKKKLSQPQPPEKKKLKKERLTANPLRGLTTRSSGSSSCSNGSGSGSHRFLLSHSLSSSSSSMGVNPHNGGGVRPVKSVSKTPKSAPVLSKPLIRKKPKSLKSNVTEKPTFGKRVTSGKITTKPEKGSVRVDDSIATPVSSRSNCNAATDDGGVSNSYKEKTPPVQASVSPEMHCGSSMSLSASAQSQACYAAGHLLSGVSDKRKCKPKGILTVGRENGFEVGKGKILNDSDEFDQGDFGSNMISMMPLPADASVHWLLSPCDEEKEDENGFSQFQEIVECVGNETPSDLCNISGGRSLSPMSICKETMVRRTSSSLSPNELSRFRRFMQLSSCEVDPSERLGGDKRSPLTVDTLGSDNVIQTPDSNSSFDSYFGLSSCSQGEIKKKLEVGSDLESLTMTLQSARLSPPQEQSSSSFNFESLATSSDSIDLSQFQRGLGNRSPRVTRERVSKKHVKVSQNEETYSHLPQLIRDTEFDMRNDKEGRELLPCSVAESISTDGGGGLICSEDSNWMACYNKS